MAFLLCLIHIININDRKVRLMSVDRYDNVMVLQYHLNIELFNYGVGTMNPMIFVAIKVAHPWLVNDKKCKVIMHVFHLH